MLTRLRFRRDFRLIVRCMSDKTNDDGKVPENKIEGKEETKKSADGTTEKIQELLKSMMAAPQISDEEYQRRFTVAPERPKKENKDEDEIVTMEKIEKSLTDAASDVAHAMGGNVKQTEAELLSRVLGKINQTTTSLSDLLVGMKVDRSKDPEQSERRESRGQQVKRLVDKSNSEQKTRFMQRKSQRSDLQMKPDRSQPRAQATTVNIFSGTPLGIFKSGESNYGTSLATWETLKQRELALATAQPPANYFEKMILWTDQGKVWKFPIDNEQGLEEEQKVHFSEHVFIDSLLEDWCPKKGPIRHFMELVCVGLSKNAFYTVQEKKDHIMWYKEYFESKKDLLTEIGAWETREKSSGSEASI